MLLNMEESTENLGCLHRLFDRDFIPQIVVVGRDFPLSQQLFGLPEVLSDNDSSSAIVILGTVTSENVDVHCYPTFLNARIEDRSKPFYLFSSSCARIGAIHLSKKDCDGLHQMM